MCIYSYECKIGFYFPCILKWNCKAYCTRNCPLLFFFAKLKYHALCNENIVQSGRQFYIPIQDNILGDYRKQIVLLFSKKWSEITLEVSIF